MAQRRATNRKYVTNRKKKEKEDQTQKWKKRTL